MKKRICPNCGNEIEDGEKFCNNCGTPIPEKKKMNFKIIGIAIACLVVFVVGIGVLSGREEETMVIKPDKLSIIMLDNDKAKDYLDKPIKTTGYLIRDDDEEIKNKLTDDNTFIICSGINGLKKGNIVMLEYDNAKQLKNIGTFSKLTLEGKLVQHESDAVFFDAEKITVDKKLTKEEGKKVLYQKLGVKDESNDTDEIEANAKDDVVKDGDTTTVDDLLSDPSKYAGKILKVHGMFPQALTRASDGRDIVAINNFNLDKYVEIKGGSPNFGGCEGIVTGNIILDNGTPIINASSFESIGSTLSADTSDAYYPITDGYTGYTDTYIANYNMTIRSDYSSSASKVDTLKEGQYVEIRDIKSTGQDTWGLIQPGKWVCIEDWSDGEIQYLTEVGGD